MKADGSMRSKLGGGSWACGAVLATALLMAYARAAHAVAQPWQLNMTPGVTQTSHEVYEIHMWAFYVCCVIGVIVFGAMIWAMIFHRKSRGAVAATWSHNTKAEIVWTIAPIVILVALAAPATKVMINMAHTQESQMTVKITGYQWKWGYDYIKGEGEGIGFVSTLDATHREMSQTGGPKSGQTVDNYLLKVDNPLVVPVNKKVRVITTANDVIHAFMVPAFGIKQDAIPGFVRDTWFRAEKIGDYYGQCAELCGKEHAYMPIHVKVVSAEDYSKWVGAEQKKLAAKADDPSKVWTLDDILKRGEKVYAANCAACHQASGKGAGPIKPLDGAAVVLDADKTKQIMVLLNGQNNGAMPAWKQLSDTDLASVITYTKNSWSNKTGQLVQPAEVLAARK